MSFNIGLSGLRAATSDLNVTGNNISNAGTVGFKQSRAEFADVYAASVLGSGSNPQGSGVLLADVSQLFNQGNINYTKNSLDLAINGNGFFTVSNNGAVSYTRAGYFGTDKSGYIVDNFGYRLQGYGVDANGNLINGVQTDLQVQTDSQEPKPTSAITQNFNLNSTSLRPANAATFNPNDPLSYNSSTSVNIYDSQGNSHVLTQYFVKNAAPATNQWTMHVLIDGVNPATPTVAGPPVAANVAPYSYTVSFDSAGQLQSIAALAGAPAVSDPTGIFNFPAASWTPTAPDPVNTGLRIANGAAPNATGFTMDIRSSTQFASTFAVNSITQDGYTTGQLAGLEIDDTGVIFARYTNGQSKTQGQVVLANFANVQGLTPQGKTQWVQSFESGEPVVGTPRSGTLGALQSGALEDSNVELSDQLVNLIVAQRNYQANAKTIETESAITQTILNIR
ncbi:MAG: flagellar hook protein FlgE [Aquabacterium sp.]|nr:MAG: flagellar hook protein FlgE [Aquabacterium sp.]